MIKLKWARNLSVIVGVGFLLIALYQLKRKDFISLTINSTVSILSFIIAYINHKNILENAKER